jgi:hypothetical protein
MSNIIQEGEDKLDIDSGYFTREAFTVGSEECALFEDTVTQLIVDAKQERGDRTWYLTTITLPGGILFPDGEVDNYKWIVAPVVAVLDEDKGNYPIPGEKGESYNSRVGIEDAKQFGQFKEGLVYLGML